jgi:dipeptidase E
VGVSAGSMVVTPNFGEAYDDWFCREPPASHLPKGLDRALGLVDFSVFPHLDHPESPDNSLANAARWAAKGPVPTYAIDDQTAIKAIDGAVEVVSEGHWKRFTPKPRVRPHVGFPGFSRLTPDARFFDENASPDPSGYFQ